MTPYRFRGHGSGLDLEATLERFPQLGSGPGAVDALREALDAEGERRAADVRERLHALEAEWGERAEAARRSRRTDPALAAFPQRMQALVASIPDASAIVERALPRGLLARAVARQPAARISRQGLRDLVRVLERRLDPAIARELAADAALQAVVAGLVAERAAGDQGTAGSDDPAPST